MKKRLLLLRHARHAASIHRQFLGSTDIPLSEQGHREAAAIVPLINTYHPERCFCSPLKRCFETIKPLKALQFEFDSDLREIDFGKWEGLTFEQIQKSDPAAADRWADYDPQFRFPEGEQIGDFLDRVSNIADTITSCEEKTILAVTHAGIIRALICHFLGLHPRHYLLFEIEYASLTILDLFEGKGVLKGLNLRCRMEET